MPAQSGTAYVEFVGDFSALQKQVAAQVAPLQSRFGKLGKAAPAALAGVGVAAAAAGKALYDVGSEFDKATDTIRAGTGATGKHLDRLKADFKDVVSSVPTDFDNAAKAITDVNRRLGVTGRPLRDLSKRFLELSRLTGTDLETNIQNVSRAFADAGVKTGKQSEALDGLFRVSQKTGVNIGDLTDLMVRFGSPLRQLGFNFDTAAAMFAKFEREGVNVQTAMPGLRMALKNFAQEGREPAKALQETFKQIQQTGDAAKANTLAFEIFGTRAGPDMAAAILEGRFNYQDLVKVMRNGKGTIQGAAKDTNDAGENWRIFANKLKVLVEPAATAVFNAINNFNPNEAVAAIQRVVASLQRFWKESGVVRAVITTLGRAIGNTFRESFAAVKQILSGLFQVVKGVVQVISGVLTGDFGRAWKGVKNIFGGAVKFVIGVVRGLVAPIVGVARTIGGVFRDPIGTIKDLFSSLPGFIGKIVGKIPGIISGIFSRGGQLVANIGRAIADWINDHTPFGDSIDVGPVNIDLPALARGGRVTAPMVMVGEEAPRHPEYVLATNPAYRKRNVGLWMAAGQDLGMPGFARGGVIPQPANKHHLTTLSRFVGAGQNELMGAIGMGESRGDRKAVGGAGERGFWQILGSTAEAFGLPWSRLFDAIENAKGMKKIKDGQGLTAWSVYKNGSYRPHLGGQVLPGLLARLRGDTGAHKSTKGKGTRKAKRLGLPAKLQDAINAATGNADLFEDYASRAGTLEDLVFGRDEIAWLQAELTELFRLRNLLVRAVQYLQRELAALGDVRVLRNQGKGGKAAKGGGKGPAPSDSWAATYAKASGTGIVKVGRALQAFGYEVSEHPAFGGVSRVHVPGSAHYAGRALDVNHDVRGNEMSALDLISKKLRKLPHSQIIWRNRDLDTGAFIANHMNHLHFAMRRGGVIARQMLGDLIPGFAKGGKRGGRGKGMAADAIKKQREALTGQLDTVTSTLEEIQGRGSPIAILQGRPRVGELGGRIFDVQAQIRDAGQDAGGNAGPDGPKGLSAADLRNLRFLSDLGVKFNPGQFAGMFAAGGTIGPGQWGIAGETGRPEIVQGPARVHSPGDSAALLGGPDVLYADIYIGGEKIDERVETRLRTRDRALRQTNIAGVR